jgi:hypothetical protein
MGYPAQIMALSSWRMEILFPDSRFQIPQVSGLAKMTLSKYPSFRIMQVETRNWKLETVGHFMAER